MCPHLVGTKEVMLTVIIQISLVLAITATTQHSHRRIYLWFYLGRGRGGGSLNCVPQGQYSHLTSGPSFQHEDSEIYDW